MKLVFMVRKFNCINFAIINFRGMGVTGYVRVRAFVLQNVCAPLTAAVASLVVSVMTSNGRRRRESSSESESNSHQPVADKRLTICVIGSGAVGKSSLTVRYLQGHFPEVSNTKTQICSGHACSMLVGAGDNCCQIICDRSLSILFVDGAIAVYRWL